MDQIDWCPGIGHSNEKFQRRAMKNCKLAIPLENKPSSLLFLSPVHCIRTGIGKLEWAEMKFRGLSSFGIFLALGELGKHCLKRAQSLPCNLQAPTPTMMM